MLRPQSVPASPHTAAGTEGLPGGCTHPVQTRFWLGAPQVSLPAAAWGAVAVLQLRNPRSQQHGSPGKSPPAPACSGNQQGQGHPEPTSKPPSPTWLWRLQGCPSTAAAQAQSRPQTGSRPAGAIWLQEAAGQKNKFEGGWRSRPCRRSVVVTGDAHPRPGHGHHDAPRCRSPGASPAAVLHRARRRLGYTLTTAPRRPGGCSGQRQAPGRLAGAQREVGMEVAPQEGRAQESGLRTADLGAAHQPCPGVSEKQGNDPRGKGFPATCP